SRLRAKRCRRSWDRSRKHSPAGARPLRWVAPLIEIRRAQAARLHLGADAPEGSIAKLVALEAVPTWRAIRRLWATLGTGGSSQKSLRTCDVRHRGHPRL